MTSELAMKSKEIESQVANHIRNLQMELESYQQRLKEEQDIARRATAQGDRSENAEWQIANDAIARINVSIMSLSDTIATYKKFSTSYIPTGKVRVEPTMTFPVGMYDCHIQEVLHILHPYREGHGRLYPEGHRPQTQRHSLHQDLSHWPWQCKNRCHFCGYASRGSRTWQVKGCRGHREGPVGLYPLLH